MSNDNKINEWLSLISQGDEKAFIKFHDYYFQKIFRFSRYFIKAEYYCQDVVSEVFISLWKNRNKLIKIRDIDAYIFILTKNKALDLIYKDQSKKEQMYDLSLLPYLTNETPEKIYMDEELTTIIKECVNQLPEKCKLIFLMNKELGLKYHEIANILSISERTVNAQLVIALKKLGSSLKKYFSFF